MDSVKLKQNLLDVKRGFSICRAVWTSPLQHESTAPERRIIHANTLRLPSAVKINRVGVKKALGYFKCGSYREQDWVRDFRILAWTGDQWEVVLEKRDLPKPDEDEVNWYDFEDLTTADMILEIRRCGIDNWWPSWNLAEGAFIVEGDMPERRQIVQNILEKGEISFKDLPEGVTAHEASGQIVYETPFYKVGFYMGRPGFSQLAVDHEGVGDTRDNLIPHASPLFLGHHGVKEYLVSGIRMEQIGGGQAASFSAFHYEGCVHVKGNRLVYDLKCTQTGEHAQLEWVIGPRAMSLNIIRNISRDIRAWSSSLWHMPFDCNVTPVTTLAKTIRKGETGLVNFPLLLHAPGKGSFKISTGDNNVLWRMDSVRPHHIVTGEIKLGEIPTEQGDYAIATGQYKASFKWEVYSMQPNLKLDTPAVVQKALEKCLPTALTYRPDTDTFSNNANSMHGVICMDSWSDISVNMHDIIPGLSAMDLLKNTLERWLDGGPGYGNGKTLIGGQFHDLEDEYLMTGAAALLGLAEYLEKYPDKAWHMKYKQAIQAQLKAMEKRDLDGDGLIESDHRRGVSGEHQWSTCWYDVISFGWKDAFSNALLYSALEKLYKVLYIIGENHQAEPIKIWADKIKQNYYNTFYNENTGWLAGWKCKEGKLHDYGFLFVNGAAICAGLIQPEVARQMIEKLWDGLINLGLWDLSLGLPGNIIPINDEDMAPAMHGQPLGFYQNAGLTHSQTRHFVGALYQTGMQKEGDMLLNKLCQSLENGTAFGGCGSGVDWKTWDGRPSGYEGLLTDQFGILAQALKRYQK